jgi:hypothetical protein
VADDEGIPPLLRTTSKRLRFRRDAAAYLAEASMVDVVDALNFATASRIRSRGSSASGPSAAQLVKRLNRSCASA